MAEDCESEIANLLASMANLPEADVDGKFAVLQKIFELLQGQIEDLQEQLDDHFEDYEHKERSYK